MTYIGVMGFTKGLEVEEILRTEKFDNGKKLMAGTVLNQDILEGKTPLDRNKYPLKIEDIPNDIFISDERVVNFIKFEDEIFSFKQLDQIRKLGGDNLKGLILSFWPNPGELKAFKESFPEVKIFLEIHRRRVEDYLELCRQLWSFKDSVDGVILESCYPHCSDFDRLYINDCIEYLSTQFREDQIGVNGIKKMTETEKTKPLLQKHPSLGIVMEDSLRTKERHLDLNKVRKYTSFFLNS